MMSRQFPVLPPLPEGISPFEITKGLAAQAHPQIVNDLAMRAMDNTISTTSLLAISDHLGKISGLYAKQEEKADQGRFVFNIHLGSGNISVSAEPEAIDVTPEKPFMAQFADDLAPAPTWMAAKPRGNLTDTVFEV